ncbi:MAG: double-strand break repair helicase AddA [Pseudomonadota bacterium]
MNAEARIKETTEAQRRAADPSLSVFVSANAGAGKTRVLTNRVARLLLDDVNPSTVLCITFTKAAAAEMADRLFKLLGGWALADDATLQSALADLDGVDRARSPDELARARRLFARALETPGGLKIQTIHSFCESVLKRFPLEAGVAPGFTVIEEIEAGELKRMSVDRAAAGAAGGIEAAFAHLLSRMTGRDLRSLLEDSLIKRRKFSRAGAIGWSALGDEVAAALGANESESAEELSAALFADLPRERLEDALAALDASGGNPQEYCAPPLRDYLRSDSREERLAALRSLFLVSNGEARKKFGTLKTQRIDASIEPFLKETQQLFLDGIDRIRAAEALADTRALFAILEKCLSEYAAMKAARAALDFDDLIAATRRLFASNGGAGWVLYKLDMGLAHILLDEAQDTGPDSWDVIEAPLGEFFSGEGARDRIRTFFAVGDQKQSIYSFQGADAALFKEKEENLGKRIGAARAYESVPLKASFRTAAPVLEFVDALFSRDEVIENVSLERPLEHFCTRAGAAGLVELWPLVPRPETEKPNPWDAPLDAKPAESPPRKLAEEVARTIAHWIGNREILQSQGRPIEPGDILILVQSRGALFAEMIRALGAARVPVAGADKIRLMEDQGVLDLVSYARAALFEGDDLSLAETLKSPFFGVSEESLYELAANRGRMRLSEALRRRSDEREDWRRADDEIAAARSVALKEGAAAFFTHILDTGAPSGWRRLAERLGSPCREPIEEFLRQAHEFETLHPRSLRLFLNAMEKSGAEISRDASEADSTVRVMTAHKAKGLEANIVFLLDAHRHPPLKNIGGLLAISGPSGDEIPALALGDAKDNSALVFARDRARRLMRDEYRRLLYVASTRARDRLYICGCERGDLHDPHKPSPAEKTWHALAEDAFAALGDRIERGGERFGAPALRLSAPQTAAAKDERTSSASATVKAGVPGCLLRPACAETRARRLSPSRLVAEPDEGGAYSPAQAGDHFLRGRILHRLLELLPKVEPTQRRAAADRLLAHHEGRYDEEERAAMREEALRVLEDPTFAEVFAPGGLSEAAIGGRAKGTREELILSGQIDRLAILPTRILIVDYKTNRPPPTRIEDVPLSYLAQMAAYRGLLQEIYPGRKIEAALLWTYDARLMALPGEALDRAQALTLA